MNYHAARRDFRLGHAVYFGFFYTEDGTQSVSYIRMVPMEREGEKILLVDYIRDPFPEGLKVVEKISHEKRRGGYRVLTASTTIANELRKNLRQVGKIDFPLPSLNYVRHDFREHFEQQHDLFELGVLDQD